VWEIEGKLITFSKLEETETQSCPRAHLVLNSVKLLEKILLQGSMIELIDNKPQKLKWMQRRKAVK
jgi:hypothetical protein